MRSLCRNCVKFGKCGFVAYCDMQVLKCPDYKRGSVNHGKDVYIEVEVKRGRKLDGIANPSQVKESSNEEIELRIVNILRDFPSDFRAKDLKNAYEKKHKEEFTFTKELREKVCKPYKQGLLINKCKKRRHTRK